MKWLLKYIGPILLATSFLPAQSQFELVRTVKFERDQFTPVEQAGGLYKIETAGTDFFYKSDPEQAALPFQSLRIPVPGGAELVDYQFTYENEVFMEEIRMAANQIYQPFSFEGSYPGEVLEYVSSQSMRGQDYFCFTLSPFIYNSDQEILHLIKKLQLKVQYRIHYQESAPADPPENDVLDYLIVTTAELKDSFKPLLDWKIRKGLKAELVTLDEIYSRYEEPTDQLRIKRYLHELYKNRNLLWVLLGGDHDIVPVQYCFGKVNLMEDELEEDSIPTDLFYACFDMSFDWNGDADERVGEPHIDFVDNLPEIHISRIPVRTKEHVQTFIHKTLDYELNPPRENFMEKMLLTGVKSWQVWDQKSDNHHRSEQMYLRYVARNWSGKRFGFYDTGGSFPDGDQYEVSASNLSQQLNKGYAFFHFAGHGNKSTYLMENGTGFTCENALELNNKGSGLMLSTTCDVNAFDAHKMCLSESFLLNPHGGCVAFWGSSRLGLGIPDIDVSLGPSFQFNAKFLELLFKGEAAEGSHSFASICAAAKASLSGNDDGGGSYWYLQYALNPMGDPELPIYTRNPVLFDNVKIYSWGNRLSVNTGGVENCRICITDSDLEKSYRSLSYGRSHHTFTDVPENFILTITSPNYIPYQYRKGIYTGSGEAINSAIQIYPNPVQELMHLSIDFNEGAFTIYDINGRRMKSGMVSQGLNTISMRELEAGVYILNVRATGGVTSIKLIKQ